MSADVADMLAMFRMFEKCNSPKIERNTVKEMRSREEMKIRRDEEMKRRGKGFSGVGGQYYLGVDQRTRYFFFFWPLE